MAWDPGAPVLSRFAGSSPGSKLRAQESILSVVTQPVSCLLGEVQLSFARPCRAQAQFGGLPPCSAQQPAIPERLSLLPHRPGLSTPPDQHSVLPRGGLVFLLHLSSEPFFQPPTFLKLLERACPSPCGGHAKGHDRSWPVTSCPRSPSVSPEQIISPLPYRSPEHSVSRTGERRGL